MDLQLFAGSANEPLAMAIAACLGMEPGARDVQRFPDGELSVRLQDSVRGSDVYLVQPTGPPADQHLVELLLIDAARRAGAARVTAVVPYLGYARQDRRATRREPVTARLVADLLEAARLDRAVGRLLSFRSALARRRTCGSPRRPCPGLSSRPDASLADRRSMISVPPR